MMERKKVKKWVNIGIPPFWVEAEFARYEQELITPTNRFADAERYVYRGKHNVRKHTRKIRTQMFKYAMSEGFASPPEGMRHNISIDSNGIMEVPGYIRASSDSFIYGYLWYRDGRTVGFEKHSEDIGYNFDYYMYDRLLRDGYVLFHKDWQGENFRKIYLPKFFRFYEFPTKDAEGFDCYKRKRLEKSPQYWKAEVVRESLLDYYGSYITRAIVNYEKAESRMRREDIAHSCRRKNGSARECRRQLRLMGFVA